MPTAVAAHPPSTPKTSTPELPPSPSPPRPKGHRRKGQTRFEKEQAASGGKSAADQPGDPKIIGPWRIGKTIGKGASGRVKIAKHNKTGQFAAIKIIPKHVLLMASRTSISDAAGKMDKAVLGIEREIVIMKLIDHPNIMSLFDVWETSKELFLVLEYVEGGELFDYLVSQGRLHPDEASRYFQQIIAGVDYCHRFNICHRDLKPENLLLDADRNIKIADFGMAALEPSGRLLETSCGSPHYASPEIVMGLSYHGAASDIWSCGVILYALLTGRLPFDDENIRVLLQKVKSGRFSIPSDLPADARDLIARMLVVHPDRRITMQEIMIHPFFQRRHASESGKSIRIVDPPRLEQVDRPVRYDWEIDRDILRNLRTLWSGSSEGQMVRALLSPEKNMEKAFYFLLQQYRNKNLENYNADVESPVPGSVAVFASQGQEHGVPGGDTPVPHDMPVRRIWSGGVAGDKHESERERERHAQSEKGRERRRRERERERERERDTGAGGSQRRSRRASVSGLPTKKAPTRDPRGIENGKTASRPAPAAPGKSPQTPSRRSVLGPRPPTGQTPSASPRPTGDKGATATADKDHKSTIRLVQQQHGDENHNPMTPPHPFVHGQVKGVERVPKITVQIPTPQNDQNGVVSPMTSPSPKPSPLGAGAGVGAGTSAAHPTGLGIVMPPMADAAPPSTAPSPPPAPPISAGGGGSLIGGPQPTPASPPLGSISVPQVQDAALQKFFHDIAEQLQLIGSVSPRSSLAIEAPLTPALLADEHGPSAPNTPLPTPLLDAPPQFPSGAAAQAQAQKIGAESEKARYVPSIPPPHPERPVPVRASTDAPRGTPLYQPQAASASVAERPEVLKHRSYVEESRTRTHSGNEIPDVQPRRYSTQKVEGTRRVSLREKDKSASEMKRKGKPAPLDLSPRVMYPDHLLSPTASPRLGGAGALSPGTTPGTTPMPSSPLMIGPSHDGKQSWFSNLFSWKPAVFTLISADDCASSRAECVKLLEQFGAVVIVEDADGWGVLKCRVDEIRDVSGIIIPKAVKFRIEFLPHSSAVSATPRIAHDRFASGVHGHGRGSDVGPVIHAGNGSRTAPSSPIPRGSRERDRDRDRSVGGGSIGASSSIGGAGSITTSMTMIQEKGALSAFRAVYGRIRAEWRLDSLKSPAIGGPGLTSRNGTPAGSPLPTPGLEQGQWA